MHLLHARAVRRTACAISAMRQQRGMALCALQRTLRKTKGAGSPEVLQLAIWAGEALLSGTQVRVAGVHSSEWPAARVQLLELGSVDVGDAWPLLVAALGPASAQARQARCAQQQAHESIESPGLFGPPPPEVEALVAGMAEEPDPAASPPDEDSHTRARAAAAQMPPPRPPQHAAVSDEVDEPERDEQALGGLKRRRISILGLRL
eukprot:gnl/TRDRNA2_/TRDRNA2_128726_c1_seq2.p1 gnl/TRDRNA2_/TRDRNA2_128726_c1~~gnl/TRDRNA2_/TRDRNA2_128726_c1_seq2.p1  ORF type:complete len:206 (+),score=36.59 gnl/TRDRNA2_/TRDRNA2_128726_c1_seq2:471-1088(+)